MHKVAQHYKLQTYTAGAGVSGQGQVVAKRTKWTQAPQVRAGRGCARACAAGQRAAMRVGRR